jgi:hypothetical protein
MKKNLKTANMNTRTLLPKERNFPTNSPELPLVIEPQNTKEAAPASLNEYLFKNSGFIKEAVQQLGAVLLRGFDVTADKDFEEAITSIQGMNPMNDYFMVERGRSIVPDTNYVFYTNKTFKTGGTLRFGGFHTENYYSADVPRYICFYCSKPPALGGETGLLDMTKVYEDISPSLKAKLEAKTFSAGLKLVSDVTKRYQLPVEQVIEICRKNGLELIPIEGSNDQWICFYKSSVFDHPYSKKPTLVANLACSGIENGLVDYFKQDYKGWRWLLHRLAWKYPTLVTIGDIFTTDFQLIKEEVISRLSRFRSSKGIKQEVSGFRPPITSDRIESVFTKEETGRLLAAMKDHFNSFRWKKSDILIVDNFRMAHAGMPGLGSRTIRVMLCNPTPMQLGKGMPGRQVVHETNDYTSIAQKMQQLVSDEAKLVHA